MLATTFRLIHASLFMNKKVYYAYYNNYMQVVFRA